MMTITKAWKNSAGYHYVVQLDDDAKHFDWGAVPEGMSEDDWLAMHEREMLAFAVVEPLSKEVRKEVGVKLPNEGRVLQAAGAEDATK